MAVCSERPLIIRSGKDPKGSALLGDVTPGTVVSVLEIATLADGSTRARIAALGETAASEQGTYAHPGGWLTKSKETPKQEVLLIEVGAGGGGQQSGGSPGPVAAGGARRRSAFEAIGDGLTSLFGGGGAALAAPDGASPDQRGYGH
eukprot:3458970-Prymnesium_polylepis.1